MSYYRIGIVLTQTETKFPSVENQELSKSPPAKSCIGQSVFLYDSPSTRNSAFRIAAFPLIQLHCFSSALQYNVCQEARDRLLLCDLLDCVFL